MAYELEYSPEYDAQASARAIFIRRTYAHLAGAIFAFVGLTAVLINTIDPKAMLAFFAQSPVTMLILLAPFIGAGWLADYFARSESSRALQSFGLGLYVVCSSLIFLPIL